jgi:hypothetical protein
MVFNNDIEEDYISFSLAKKLHKAGFTQIPRVGMEATLYDKKGNPVNYANYGVMYSGLNDEYIPRPTVQMAVKWILVNFLLYIEVTRIVEKYVYKVRTKRGGVLTEGKKIYTTYQHAVENAIITILKNKL